MHLNINLSRPCAPSQLHGPCRGGSSPMMAMMRMMMQMMQMMQMMMGLFSGQAPGSHCAARPSFGRQTHCGGGGFAGRPCGSPVGNFLGSPQGFQSPCPGPEQNRYNGFQAPPSGHWQSAGPGGEWCGKLPGPLQRYGGAFEQYGRQYGVDPKFLAAISMLETGHGTSKAFRYKNNAMGVSNSSGPIAFGSVEQSIERMARVLAKKNGPYAGCRTIGQIARVYCPVGAGNDLNGTNHHWPSMVSKFYGQLGGNPTVAVKA